jgi:hypothetical protein
MLGKKDFEVTTKKYSLSISYDEIIDWFIAQKLPPPGHSVTISTQRKGSSGYRYGDVTSLDRLVLSFETRE